MTKIKPGLGRGLDALLNPKSQSVIQSVPIEDNNIGADDGNSVNIIAKIPTKNIRPNPYQPRTEFDKTALKELEQSILENGLIQPITVRRVENGSYELISGERRLKAFIEIGYREIPAYIIKVESKEALLALSLIENIQREKLNPIEIALAYKRLIDECNLSQEDIAEKVGKDRTTITNSLRLLKLPEEIQQSLIKNEITTGHARALINLNDKNSQLEILRRIKTDELSVRKVEKLVKNFYKKETPVKKSPGKINGNKFQTDVHISALENKLRGIFGTKVICKQKKDGSGEIVLEFYSTEELERLIELIESIENK